MELVAGQRWAYRDSNNHFIVEVSDAKGTAKIIQSIGETAFPLDFAYNIQLNLVSFKNGNDTFYANNAYWDRTLILFKEPKGPIEYTWEYLVGQDRP
jgi:hypothetical protein